MRAPALLLLCLAGAGCAGGVPRPAESQVMSEKVLAARKLQKPLTSPLCKAALYPASEGAWRVERVSLLAGRGPSLEEALEALCREADGLQAQAVSDIYTTRAPSGWAPTHEVRGWALRYEGGFSPPPPPPRAEVRPLALVPAEEPPPLGETPEPIAPKSP